VSWDFGDGSSSSDLNPAHTYTNNGVFQAHMSARSTAGCIYKSTQTISVTAPEGSARMKSGFNCMDIPLQITATAFNTDSIEWNFGDGTKSVTANTGSVYHNYRNAGVYAPKVFLKNISGCVRELKLSDTVRVENIKTGFQAVVRKSCGFTDVQFIDTTRSLYGISQIKWTLGNGTTATGNTTNQRYTVGGNYQIKMETSGASGCRDTATYSIAVDVKKKPQARIAASNAACSEVMTSFKSSTQSADQISYYNWQVSNGYTVGTEQLNYRFATPGNYRVTLIAGTDQQCFDTTSLDVQVLQSPSLNATNDVTICRDKSIALQATGAATYSWYPVEGLNCTNCAAPVARPFASTQYVVKGTGANGCYKFDTVNVSVKQPFKISVSKSDSICLGKTMQLTASGAQSYSWLPSTGLNNPLSGTPVAAPAISTTYRVIGSDNQCYTDTAYVRVGVGKIPAIELGDDQVLNTGAPYKIKPVVTNGPIKTWSWTPSNDLSCGDCEQPVAAPGNNTTYVATATTAYGCVAKDTISFKVFCENSQVFVPNGFTPDGDGINDVLMVRARGISKVRYFRIFNRWGEIVFERYNFQPNDPANGWDGKMKGQESGPAVYVYMLEVECSNGTPFNYKGNITLIK
jgi:gliding motility-associated-like protein